MKLYSETIQEKYDDCEKNRKDLFESTKNIINV